MFKIYWVTNGARCLRWDTSVNVGRPNVDPEVDALDYLKHLVRLYPDEKYILTYEEAK